MGKHFLLVVGGSGYVGSNILQRAVQKGLKVRSLTRTGRPAWSDNVPWTDKVIIYPWIHRYDWLNNLSIRLSLLINASMIDMSTVSCARLEECPWWILCMSPSCPRAHICVVCHSMVLSCIGSIYWPAYLTTIDLSIYYMYMYEYIDEYIIHTYSP